MQILLADFKDLLFNQMLQAYQVNFKTNEQKSCEFSYSINHCCENLI